jgi:hypothetical protein
MPREYPPNDILFFIMFVHLNSFSQRWFHLHSEYPLYHFNCCSHRPKWIDQYHLENAFQHGPKWTIRASIKESCHPLSKTAKKAISAKSLKEIIKLITQEVVKSYGTLYCSLLSFFLRFKVDFVTLQLLNNLIFSMYCQLIS